MRIKSYPARICIGAYLGDYWAHAFLIQSNWFYYCSPHWWLYRMGQSVSPRKPEATERKQTQGLRVFGFCQFVSSFVWDAFLWRSMKEPRYKELIFDYDFVVSTESSGNSFSRSIGRTCSSRLFAFLHSCRGMEHRKRIWSAAWKSAYIIKSASDYEDAVIHNCTKVDMSWKRQHTGSSKPSISCSDLPTHVAVALAFDLSYLGCVIHRPFS